MNKDKLMRKDFCATHQNTVSQMQAIHFLQNPTKCPCSEQFHTIWGTCCCFFVLLHNRKKNCDKELISLLTHILGWVSQHQKNGSSLSWSVNKVEVLSMHSCSRNSCFCFILCHFRGCWFLLCGERDFSAAWSFWTILDVRPSVQHNVTCS